MGNGNELEYLDREWSAFSPLSVGFVIFCNMMEEMEVQSPIMENEGKKFRQFGSGKRWRRNICTVWWLGIEDAKLNQSKSVKFRSLRKKKQAI